MIIGIDASQANAAVRTGTEWYAFDLLHALGGVREGEEYRLYLESPLREDFGLGPGFSPRVLRWPPGRFWHQARLSLEMMGAPPDVLFSPAHTLPLAHPRRCVATVHDLGFEDLPHLYPAVERAYQRATLHHALRTASRIIVPSEFTRGRILDRFPVPREKLTVIHHGFSPERFAPVADEGFRETIRSRFGLSRPFLLFVGRIGHKKNVPNLVRAFAEARRMGLATHDLVLVGVADFGAEEVARVIREEQLSSCVRVAGYCPAGMLPTLMAMAEAYALVSRYEGFGIPVLESFAVGTPVLVSRSGSLPEIAGDAALTVDADDVPATAEALLRLASDGGLRTALREKGRARLRDFSWETAARRTREVLLEA
jgi:glycosyltransferase involved in cell wall biosynthesis